MTKDLAYYRLLPYEREWLMRESAGQKYFVVRLKDLPAVAGDGVSRDEAVEDLREAFDEMVSTWLETGHAVPEPGRPHTVPSTSTRSPVREWPGTIPEHQSVSGATPDWVDNAVVYTNNVLVGTLVAAPRLNTELETAVIG